MLLWASPPLSVFFVIIFVKTEFRLQDESSYSISVNRTPINQLGMLDLITTCEDKTVLYQAKRKKITAADLNEKVTIFPEFLKTTRSCATRRESLI